MADLCGPSNPVRKFQQHTANDRSLQQDRLVGPYARVEQFRTAPNPSEIKLVEAEFEAFENSKPPEPSYIDPHPFQHVSAGPASSSGQISSDWATDFQNLHLHESRNSPIPSSQFHHLAPLQRSHVDPWRTEFSGFQQGSTSRPAVAASPSPQRQWYPTPSLQHQSLIPNSNFSATINSEQQPQPNVASQLDEETFARAFEQAEQDLRLKGAPQDLSQPDFASESASAQIKIGSDLIGKPEHSQSDAGDRDQQADELARTAGHLLDSVKDDRSSKFRESNFMSLMRQLRDREVQVEGDKIVESAQPLHPGGVHYPSPPRSGQAERLEGSLATMETEESISIQNALQA